MIPLLLILAFYGPCFERTYVEEMRCPEGFPYVARSTLSVYGVRTCREFWAGFRPIDCATFNDPIEPGVIRYGWTP